MNSKQTRRVFLSAAGASATTFTILKSGSARTYTANEKLNVAHIGGGGRAGSNLRGTSSENIVAICDVDWQRAAEGFATYPRAHRYRDYRVMLDELDQQIDAVVVSTPDHSHFPAAMAAIGRGKHVYCEKPLTHSVWEARTLTQAARKAGVATQMGNQAQADKDTRIIQEYIIDNAVGPVTEAHIWTDRPSRGLFGEYWPQGVTRPADAPPVPDTMDWDLWLGPAPERPWNPAYAPFNWRGWWDFGTGALGDMGCHYFDPVYRALKLSAPETVEAVSTRVNEETYPLGSMVTFRFAERENMPAVTVKWYDGGLRPERPAALQEGDVMGANGVMLVGTEGILMTPWGEPWEMFPRQLGLDYGKPPEVLQRSPGHHEEWVAACKGGPSAGSNFDWAGPLTEGVLLGNIALRSQLRDDLTGKRLHWDSQQMRFTNHEAANTFLRRDYRDGWGI